MFEKLSHLQIKYFAYNILQIAHIKTAKRLERHPIKNIFKLISVFFYLVRRE